MFEHKLSAPGPAYFNAPLDAMLAELQLDDEGFCQQQDSPQLWRYRLSQWREGKNTPFNKDSFRPLAHKIAEILKTPATQLFPEDFKKCPENYPAFFEKHFGKIEDAVTRSPEATPEETLTFGACLRAVLRGPGGFKNIDDAALALKMDRAFLTRVLNGSFVKDKKYWLKPSNILGKTRLDIIKNCPVYKNDAAIRKCFNELYAKRYALDNKTSVDADIYEQRRDSFGKILYDVLITSGAFEKVTHVSAALGLFGSQFYSILSDDKKRITTKAFWYKEIKGRSRLKIISDAIENIDTQEKKDFAAIKFLEWMEEFRKLQDTRGQNKEDIHLNLKPETVKIFTACWRACASEVLTQLVHLKALEAYKKNHHTLKTLTDNEIKNISEHVPAEIRPFIDSVLSGKQILQKDYKIIALGICKTNEYAKKYPAFFTTEPGETFDIQWFTRGATDGDDEVSMLRRLTHLMPELRQLAA